MCGVTRMDKTSNEEIRRRVGVQNCVMRLFGDVERMDDERVAKKLYDSGVQGR